MFNWHFALANLPAFCKLFLCELVCVCVRISLIYSMFRHLDVLDVSLVFGFKIKNKITQRMHTRTKSETNAKEYARNR